MLSLCSSAYQLIIERNEENQNTNINKKQEQKRIEKGEREKRRRERGERKGEKREGKGER